MKYHHDTVTIAATCRWHDEPRRATVEVSATSLRDYLNGDPVILVQTAFPDLTPNQREIVIEQRVRGAYMCEDCWAEMGEEE